MTVMADESGTGCMYYYWSEDKNKKIKIYMCYATSQDGLKWEKPNLGQFEWEGDGTKNKQHPPQRPGMSCSPPGSRTRTNAIRGWGGGGYHAYSSPDGIHWKKQ